MDRTEFERLADQGAKNFKTQEGRQYEAQFEKVFLPRFGAALGECKNEPDTKEPAMVVFVIAANGMFGECNSCFTCPFAAITNTTIAGSLVSGSFLHSPSAAPNRGKKTFSNCASYCRPSCVLKFFAP